MTKQTQTADSDREKKPKPQAESVGPQSTSEVLLPGLLPGGPQAAAGGGSIEGQAALLSSRPWQGAQRQALVAQMGRVQGNRHVQRLLATSEVQIQNSKSAIASNLLPSTTIQRTDDEWNKAYGTHKSYLQWSYEDFKGGLGEIKSTTQGGLTENKGRPIKSRKGAGTPAAPEITLEVLKEIYTGLAVDAAADPLKEEKAKNYCQSLNQAFKLMKIDTVEAQAVYLAHAYIESDQFRQFTETQGAVDGGKQKWVDDPSQLKLDMGDLNERYNKTDTPTNRKRKQSVNPLGKFEFLGRGPVQVTHGYNYVEVIALLEKAAEQYQPAADNGDAEAGEYATLAQEAADAIKLDPKQAANPKYTMLVSAATMKKQGADVSAAQVKTNTPWTGADAASGWVAGGKQQAGSPQAAALIEKSAAYDRIYPVLLREAKNAATQTQSPTPQPVQPKATNVNQQMASTPGVLQRETTPNSAASKSEREQILDVAARAQEKPADGKPLSNTRLMIIAAEMVYRLVQLYLPDQVDRISGVGFSEALAGVRAEPEQKWIMAGGRENPKQKKILNEARKKRQQESLSITVGKPFVMGSSGTNLTDKDLDEGMIGLRRAILGDPRQAVIEEILPEVVGDSVGAEGAVYTADPGPGPGTKNKMAKKLWGGLDIEAQQKITPGYTTCGTLPPYILDQLGGVTDRGVTSGGLGGVREGIAVTKKGKDKDGKDRDEPVKMPKNATNEADVKKLYGPNAWIDDDGQVYRGGARNLGAWVNNDGNNRPKPGDIFILENSKKKIKHIGAFVSREEPKDGKEIWETADAGQGGSPNQQANRQKRTYDIKNKSVGGSADEGIVVGWVDLELLLLKSAEKEVAKK